MQTRSEGCILFSTTEQRFTEVCSLSMEGDSVRVPLPVLWYRTNTTDIHKAPKSSHCTFKANKYPCDNIPGRHTPIGVNNLRVDYDSRYSDFSITKSRVHNKSKEISLQSCSEDRISWSNDRLLRDDTITTTRKGSKNCNPVPNISDQNTGDTEGIDPINRAIIVNRLKL